MYHEVAYAALAPGPLKFSFRKAGFLTRPPTATVHIVERERRYPA